jgi:hypothetical protein
LSEDEALKNEGTSVEGKIETDAAQRLRQSFMNFAEMARYTEHEELQKLMRLFVRKIEWMPDGGHWAPYYLPRGSKATPKPSPVKAKQPMSKDLPQSMDWFATNVRPHGPDRWHVEPVFLELSLEDALVLHLRKATLGCDSSTATFTCSTMRLNSQP